MRSRNTSQCLTAPISYLHRLRYLTIRRRGINFGFYLQSFSAEIWDAPPLQFFPVQASSPRCMIQKLLICEYRGHSYLQSTLNSPKGKKRLCFIIWCIFFCSSLLCSPMLLYLIWARLQKVNITGQEGQESKNEMDLSMYYLWWRRSIRVQTVIEEIRWETMERQPLILLIYRPTHV